MTQTFSKPGARSERGVAAGDNAQPTCARCTLVRFRFDGEYAIKTKTMGAPATTPWGHPAAQTRLPRALLRSPAWRKCVPPLTSSPPGGARAAWSNRTAAWQTPPLLSNNTKNSSSLALESNRIWMLQRAAGDGHACLKTPSANTYARTPPTQRKSTRGLTHTQTRHNRGCWGVFAGSVDVQGSRRCARPGCQRETTALRTKTTRSAIMMRISHAMTYIEYTPCPDAALSLSSAAYNATLYNVCTTNLPKHNCQNHSASAGMATSMRRHTTTCYLMQAGLPLEPPMQLQGYAPERPPRSSSD